MYSDFSMINTSNSEFYPYLIHATYSFLNITNNTFINSKVSYGSYQIIAIKAEHNMSFEIKENDFEGIENSINGPVIKKEKNIFIS